jgi:hypothetical protein
MPSIRAESVVCFLGLANLLIVSIRQELQQHELIVAASLLLHKAAHQTEHLDRLERHYPNTIKGERDSDGTILIEGFHGNLWRLLDEINEPLSTIP